MLSVLCSPTLLPSVNKVTKVFSVAFEMGAQSRHVYKQRVKVIEPVTPLPAQLYPLSAHTHRQNGREKEREMNKEVGVTPALATLARAAAGLTQSPCPVQFN